MNNGNWSEWIKWAGSPERPENIAPHTEVQVKNEFGATILRLETRPVLGKEIEWSDIIAYRYKIKEPESGIAEADEEECLQLAYERMGDESVKVSVDELHDNVNKPKHYQLREGYEVYDLRQDLAAKAANGGATYDQYSDWDRAIEYIVRMWGKNRLEDAKKGRWYLDKLIWKLEAEESAR